MEPQQKSLAKAKKLRLGARGIPKVKTGCQICKYAFPPPALMNKSIFTQ
jgi:hypothetical protein